MNKLEIFKYNNLHLNQALSFATPPVGRLAHTMRPRAQIQVGVSSSRDTRTGPLSSRRNPTNDRIAMAESDDNGGKRNAACQSGTRVQGFSRLIPTPIRQRPSPLDAGSSQSKIRREPIETSAPDQSHSHTTNLPDDFQRRLMVSLAKRAAREDYERLLREG